MILHLTTCCGFSILLTTEVVPKIFKNLNVIAHLVVPAGWGTYLPRMAIFLQLINLSGKVRKVGTQEILWL